MKTIFLFMMVSLDGFFEGVNHDLSWHHVDAEFNDFALKQLDEVDILLFGRRTYELMAGYWPTEMAKNDDPQIAGRMNSLAKVVFSTTLETAKWQNTQLVKNRAVQEVQKLKEQPGKAIAILGSSNLTVSLLKAGLVDELRIMVNPVVLGQGTSLLAGIDQKVELKLKATRNFQSGNTLLTFQPIK